MVRIDCLIFGYRKIKISPETLSVATSVLLRASIPSRINADGTLTVRERDFLKIKDLFKGRIEFEHSEPLGLFGKYKCLPYKTAYFSAIFLSFFLILFLSNFVWDIRIDGNVNIPDSDIALRLSECGFQIGDFWGAKDRSRIESNYLESDGRISWININRRGSVAYISVIEKEDKEEIDSEISGYSNLVATADCVIEEITVKRGTAAVKPGDVVKKGDILIIGILPEEVGGAFCAAEGSDLGRINEQITVCVDRKYDEIVEKEKKIYSITLNFFKISINIFKLYGNLTDKYDIIDTEKTYSLFGKCRLPLSVSIKYIPDYSFEEMEYTDEELVGVASSRLDALTAIRLCASDLLKIRSYGEFTEEGYLMSSDIVFLSDVTERMEFDARERKERTRDRKNRNDKFKRGYRRYVRGI